MPRPKTRNQGKFTWRTHEIIKRIEQAEGTLEKNSQAMQRLNKVLDDLGMPKIVKAPNRRKKDAAP